MPTQLDRNRSTLKYGDHTRTRIAGAYEQQASRRTHALPSATRDMRGSRVRWAAISAVESDGLRLLPPLDQAWLRRRTVDLYRLWEHEPAVPL